MKKFFFTSLLFLCFLSARPQKSADIGIRIGAAAYWGDIENVDYSKSITPLYGVLGRYNFNKRMSVRGQLVTGNLKAYGTIEGISLGEPKDDENNRFDRVTDNSYNFKRAIQTFEAIFEFNFMDYQMGSLKKDRFTPFLSLGLGGLFSGFPRRGTFILKPQDFQPWLDKNENKTNDSYIFTPIIPIGFGIKYNLTKRLGACVELCVRKTFSDNIDNLIDPVRVQNIDWIDNYNDPTPPNKFPFNIVNNPLFNNDWYGSLHLSLHWQVWTDKGVCKVNDKNNKYVKKSAF